MDHEQHFTGVWQHALWGEPRSGAYARPEYTENMRHRLSRIFLEHEIMSMFDAPCGDFTWMRRVLWPYGFRYEGADIVKPLIEKLSKENPDLSFKHCNLTATKFPNLDLWLCRDFLYLLTHEQVARVFENFLNAEIKFALFTCHHQTVFDSNSVAQPDADAQLNLLEAPFRFPEPLERIDDWYDDPNRPGLKKRFAGLWSTAQLKQPMRAFIGRFT